MSSDTSNRDGFEVAEVVDLLNWNEALAQNDSLDDSFNSTWAPVANDSGWETTTGYVEVMGGNYEWYVEHRDSFEIPNFFLKIFLGILVIVLNSHLIASVVFSPKLRQLLFYPLCLQAFFLTLSCGFGNLFQTTVQMVDYKKESSVTEFYFRKNLADELREAISKNEEGVHCAAFILSSLVNQYSNGLCVSALSLQYFLKSFLPYSFKKTIVQKIKKTCYLFLTFLITFFILLGSIYASVNHKHDCSLSFYGSKEAKSLIDGMIFYLIPVALSVMCYIAILSDPKVLSDSEPGVISNSTPDDVISMFTSCCFWAVLCFPRFIFDIFTSIVFSAPFENRSKMFYIWYYTDFAESLVILYAAANPVIYFVLCPGFLDYMARVWENVKESLFTTKTAVNMQPGVNYSAEMNNFSSNIELRKRTMKTSVY